MKTGHETNGRAAPRPRARTRWVLVARWGLGILTTLGVLGLAVGAALGGIPAGGPLLLVVAGGLSLLLWRTGIGLIPTALVGVGVTLGLGLNGFGLTHPNSVFDFAPALLGLAGGVAAVAGALGEIADRVRKRGGPATPIERKALRYGAGILAATVVVSAVLTVVARPGVALADGREASLVLTRSDVFFPRVIGVDASDGVVVVRNSDDYAHTFSIPDIGVDVYVGPRAERTIEIPETDPGTYRLLCLVTGHEAMTGIVRIS